jgi:fermentation-respiration switch protein FrsA (DUF1100 family)
MSSNTRDPRTFSRRDFVAKTALIGAALAVTRWLGSAASNDPNELSYRRDKALVGGRNMKSIQFENGPITMAGNLHLPGAFAEAGTYAAIVAVHPGGGVKEQTAGLYAQRLAEQGFVALAFDASHQGASGGEPRFLDDPMKRVADIYSAIDYLTSLPYVDANRIGALGICAGSGTAIKASSMERRIKAVATVSAVDVGAATRKGWEGKASTSDQIAMLDSVAKQRTAEAAGAAPVYIPYVPQVGDRTAPRDLQEAAEYYLTPRGQHPNAPNKMLLTSLSSMVSFTGFDRVDLLTQPLMVIAGSEAGSLWHSQELHAKAAGPKELFIVNGATHMDLYDGERVAEVVGQLAPFFKRNL